LDCFSYRKKNDELAVTFLEQAGAGTQRQLFLFWRTTARCQKRDNSRLGIPAGRRPYFTANETQVCLAKFQLFSDLRRAGGHSPALTTADF
jgi:hypothetical protein